VVPGIDYEAAADGHWYYQSWNSDKRR